jgi:hypothetical protein
VAGQVVHWTASSSCAGPAEYRFVFDRPDGTWVEIQPWSSNNTFTWDTTGQPLGFWNMQVWVRDAPFYDYEQAYGSVRPLVLCSELVSGMRYARLEGAACQRIGGRIEVDVTCAASVG